MEEYQENPLIEKDSSKNESNTVSDGQKRVSHKDMKTWLIVGFALLGGCVFGAGVLLSSINGMSGQIAAEKKDESPQYEYKKKVEESSDTITVDDAQVHYLGDDKNGYVKVVGGDWRKLDREWSKGVQYYSGMYVLLISTLESSTGSAEDYAQSLYDIAVPTLNVENVSLEKEKLGNYDEAYKLVMKDEHTASWNVEWIFEAEDEKIHYILVQGTDLESDKFKIAETFTLEVPSNE